MKTPREVLLNRHASTEPKLDAIRRLALAAIPHPTPAPVRRAFGLGSRWGLLPPWPRHALALAALWVLIAVLHFESGPSNPGAQTALEIVARPQSLLVQLSERRRQIRELLPPETEFPGPPPTRSLLFHRRPTLNVA